LQGDSRRDSGNQAGPIRSRDQCSRHRQDERENRVVPGSFCSASRRIGTDPSRLGARTSGPFRRCPNAAQNSSEKPKGLTRCCLILKRPLSPMTNDQGETTIVARYPASKSPNFLVVLLTPPCPLKCSCSLRRHRRSANLLWAPVPPSDAFS